MPRPPPRQITRTFTSTTFTKAMRVSPYFNIYGVDTSKKWPRERIYNEAAALAYVREKTTIPVPKVLETGEGNNGWYLTVERLNGIQLDEVRKKCRQQGADGLLPEGHKAEGCDACQITANYNAYVFIEQIALPQLRALRSKVSGLNGVVIPPPWVTEFDTRPAWKSKTSEVDEFVFIHGDLGPQNVLINLDTLEVSGLIDWENAGFYPEVFAGQWSIESKTYYDLYSDENTLAMLISLLE